jgi:hypothetical protein
MAPGKKMTTCCLPVSNKGHTNKKQSQYSIESVWKIEAKENKEPTPTAGRNGGRDVNKCQ